MLGDGCRQRDGFLGRGGIAEEEVGLVGTEIGSLARILDGGYDDVGSGIFLGVGLDSDAGVNILPAFRQVDMCVIHLRQRAVVLSWADELLRLAHGGEALGRSLPVTGGLF